MKKNTQRMIADIEGEVKYTRSMIGKDELDPRVMDVMARVPREEFVPPELQYAAFDNGPLPIGHGQTISQPYIVALMTDMLQLEPDHRVLEIGTGSGYQAAVLSRRWVSASTPSRSSNRWARRRQNGCSGWVTRRR